MELKKLNSIYAGHPIVNKLAGDKNSLITLKGLSGSLFPIVSASLFLKGKNKQILILPELEQAAYVYNDLSVLLPEDAVFFFPSSHKRSAKYNQPENANIVLRAEVIRQISTDGNYVVVTYPEALAEKVVSREELADKTLSLHKGEKISIDFITEVLVEYKFSRVDFVYEPGQFAIRGSIVDIFSFSSEYPFRIDFFGDEVESLRTFDIESQLSNNALEKISIIPNVQSSETATLSSSLLDVLSPGTLTWISEIELVLQKMDDIYESLNIQESLLVETVISSSSFIEGLKHFNVFAITPGPFFKNVPAIEFDSTPQPSFQKNFELLADELQRKNEEGYTNYIFSDNEKQIERLQDIFEEIRPGLNFVPINKTLHAGFVDHHLKVCCFTDHQVFERYHKFRLKSEFAHKDSIHLKELMDINPGDYIVHIDHGIGKFAGLAKIDVNGKMQEAVKLVYKDNDVLFVSIHSLHRLTKFRGKDTEDPKIHKLGSGAWQKLKHTTKTKVKDIARDLIALYAKRKEQKGFSYSPDSYLQRELEASFIYEDTPDQEKATKKVKEGMESEYPMDVLVCGDVGFGKTEVAIRAAFKAVADGKQVAVLVPTTILAFQHYNTFRDRLKDFPCSIDYISRFRTTQQIKDIINRLKEGKLDIVIGTHRLVSKDIGFKDLGLMIIDEEQKFGVAVKEKLKQMRINVDSLTMTATPIPRTLQFSLMGARELSIINTPPPNRHPIITELHSFNEEIIREAIQYEVSRNGQVFFVNNRVQNIQEVETMIRRICPGVSTVVAHGQMEGEQLEKTMLEFINGDHDVLIATSIIENGLDIPNANTIIINNAHHFGLSDLHQLRGRVGRSNKKAFCYLLAPPVTLLSADSRRRLKAIEEFSNLGSGFNIALQDMDIRGAGNLLGAEQSGFINDLGFETYSRILNEAMLELKQDEYKDVFYSKEQEENNNPQEQLHYVTDCQVDTDMPLLFPEDYVSNISERIRLYRRLDSMEDEAQLVEFEKEMNDRFGPLPEQSVELINVVRLRWLAVKLGFEKIILKNKKMIVFFISNQQSSYYQSSIFAGVLNFVQAHSRQVQMKETDNRLTMTIQSIASISDAIHLLKAIGR